ncbi:OTU-domain-containing protein [Saccharata proteae CBS 121410]|uniref:Ubiquitin thioesterase OTU n=1 Tax=Saccharata proteae CBS 121410 TaxID=1314787 RepID=A0A9P4LXN5_9PEZI|nr:OTU-domain-containing protein [Saccharata proteae CBS 121410]
MRIRVRGPSGMSTVTITPEATIAELISTIAEKSGVPTFDLKAGYPPKPLDITQFDPITRICDTELKLDNEQLIVTSRDVQGKLENPMANSTPSADSQYSSQPIPLSRKEQDMDPPEIPVPSHTGTLVLRVMPDDNSCMFRALGSAVLGQDLDSMRELRSLVAQGIQAQPELYSEVVLQKDPDDYCRWIQRDDAWGGAIELGILSQAFDIEICSINVQDLRVDRFNEGKPRRCILVYSGIHYDTIALSPSEPPHTRTDMPAELDIKQFDSFDDIILEKARELCDVLKKRHYYTDTSSFSIKCNVCGWKGNGEKQATEHAAATGHMNLSESA